MEVRAPAKVNTWLEVLGRRADGFHELRTWLFALELADAVAGEWDRDLPVGRIELSVTGPAASADIPSDSSNLVSRAAGLALDELGRRGVSVPGGLRLELRKEIPSQAGLGGGSSDAAALLWLVEALSGQEFGASWRGHVLADLGSDTVFFEATRGLGAGLATGRGEHVQPARSPEPAWWVALVTPDVPCPTGAIFAELSAPSIEGPPSEPRAIDAASLDAVEMGGVLRNDLEEPALRAAPELFAWRELLDSAVRETGTPFRLSGSGSSFFALRGTAAEAKELVERTTALARERGLGLRGRWVTRTACHSGIPTRA